MNTFEITLQRKLDASWPVVVEYTTPDEQLPVRRDGAFVIDLATLVPLEDDPHAYGTALGKAVFTDEVRAAFVEARAGMDNELRVLLNVEAADLKTLRWERLCAPLHRAWPFLALDQSVPFSLYLPSLTDQRFPPIGRRELRALIVAASPDGLPDYGLESFDVAAAVDNVRSALGDIPSDVLAPGEGHAGPPTLERISECITADHHTLLHIVCHGQVLKDGPQAGETVLYLSTADGKVAPVTATKLIERFQSLGGMGGLPHLAFLSTCESASPAAEGAFGGLAQRLVRELGMPAVVAMTEKVTIATAEALASTFYKRLREHGEVDRALVEATAGLVERPDITVPALYSRLGGRPLFSESVDRPLTATEINAGLDRLKDLLHQRAPILEPQLAAAAETLRDGAEAKPAALSDAARQERADAMQEVRSLCLEATDLDFDALATGKDPPPYDSRQPFRGLYAFGPDDQAFFFGREGLVARLKTRLDEHPFLAVLGPSGSGKSSAVLGGLLPALHRPFEIFTPSADPLAQLSAKLKAAEPSAVLVVDQFEELFTLSSDGSSRSEFIKELLSQTGEHPVVITMRADFWGECAPFPALREAMQAHQELIAPMDAVELRRAMELQAGAVGLRFEADLANTLVDEVEGEPGAMPLLQQALLELWKRRHGRWLRAAEYRAIGGVKEAIAHTADDLYMALGQADQGRVQDIFVRLTRLDDATGAGVTRRDTRRRVAAIELVPAGADPTPTKTLLAKLADARLVVTSVNAVTGDEEVEVVHEALIRYWPRLRSWLDEGRASLRIREGIREAAREWQAADQADTLLVHRGGRLDDAVTMSKQPRYALNAVEQAYLDAAVALQRTEQERELNQVRQLAEEQRQRSEIAERAQKRQRNLSIALAGLLLLAVVAVVAVFVFQQDAVRQAQGSLSRRLAAQAVDVVNDRVDLGLLLAAQAYRTEANVGTAGSLLGATQCCSGAVIGFLGGAGDRNWDVAFSPDSQKLASASNDGVVRIWDVATRQLTKVIRDPNSAAVVYAVAFNPQQPILAVGKAGPAILLYDTQTWDLIQMLPAAHTSSVFALEYSGDGKTLISGGVDGRVFAWDVADPAHITNRELMPEPGRDTPPFWIYDVAISPDGQTVAAASKDGPRGTLRLWDLASGGPARATPTPALTLNVEFASYQGQPLLLTTDSPGRLVVWDLTPWRDSRDAPTQVGGALDPTPDHNIGQAWGLEVVTDNPLSVITGTDLGGIRRDQIVPAPSGSFALTPQTLDLTGNRIGLFGIDISPDGRFVAGAGRDGLVSLWQTSEPPQTIRHGNAVKAEQVLGEEATVVSVDADGALLRSSYSTDPSVASVQVRVQLEIASSIASGGFKAAISRDGSRVVVGDNTGHLILLNTATGKSITDFPPQAEPSVPVAPTPSSTPEPTVPVLETLPATPEPSSQDTATPMPTANAGAFTSLALSADGRWLATGDLSGRVRLWSVSEDGLEGHVATYSASANAISALAFSPDGRTIVAGLCFTSSAVGCEQSEIVSLEASALKPILAWRGKSGQITSLAFNPRAPNQFAVGSVDGSVSIWDLESHDRGLVRVGSARVRSLAYKPDGSLLAIGADSDIYLYDTATLQPYAPRERDHDDSVTSLAFAPDGGALLSGSADNTIVIQDMRPEDWLARACDLANRNLNSVEWNQYIGQSTARTATCPKYSLDPTPTASP